MHIINHDPRSSEFAHLRCLSFLLELRVPSEALTTKRAFIGAELTEFPPCAERALIGLRGPEDDRMLVVRFSRRKNLPQGCIVPRPFFCKLSDTADRQLCPVHYFWPLIRRRIRPGDKLFPIFYFNKVNITLESVLLMLDIPHANRYSSHAFRLGAANELKSKGSQWPTIATLGGWRCLAFRGYLGLTLELDRDMSKILAEPDLIISDGEA